MDKFINICFELILGGVGVRGRTPRWWGWYGKRAGVSTSRIRISTVVLSTAIQGSLFNCKKAKSKNDEGKQFVINVYRVYSLIFTATFSKVSGFAISLD